MTDDDLNLPDHEAHIDALLRSMSADDLEFDAPPPDVWESIEAAVQGDEPLETNVGTVVELASRFRPRAALILAAAAAILVVVGAFVVTGGSDEPDYEVVGDADLAWAEGFVATGVDATAAATVVVAGDTEAIRLESVTLPPAPAGEDLELWLIGVDSSGELTIQTLGVIDDPDDDRAYEVPPGFDTDSFETVLVDISFEPRDGDAAHSGASVVRGPIVEA